MRASGWYGIILDETSDISRTEKVSLCLSFALNGTKKKAFIDFYSTKSNEGEVMYELVKSAVTELNLDLKNIVGKAFDGAANMNGLHKGQLWKSAPQRYLRPLLRTCAQPRPSGYHVTIGKRSGDYPGSVYLLRSESQTIRPVL